MKTKLFTHDRTVHADDVLAAAILRICFGQVQVIRTRDPAILREEMGKEGNFFLDLGGRYDPARRLFDHHQPEGAGYRNAAHREWPYATAGLVWRHYGARAVRTLHPSLDDDAVAEVVRHLDETVLKYIDAVDCGVRLKTSGPSLSAIIGSFNSAWYEREQEVFPLVLDLAQVILSNFVKRFAGKVMARDLVRQASTVMDGRVLMLQGCHPWGSVVSEEMPSVLIVVYPVEGAQQWQLRCASNIDMSPRIHLPASWAGRERDELAQVSGVEMAAFCHRSRHLAGAVTQDAALSMAQSAICAHIQANEVKAA